MGWEQYIIEQAHFIVVVRQTGKGATPLHGGLLRLASIIARALLRTMSCILLLMVVNTHVHVATYYFQGHYTPD